MLLFEQPSTLSVRPVDVSLSDNAEDFSCLFQARLASGSIVPVARYDIHPSKYDSNG